MIDTHHDNVTNATYYTCLTNHLTNFAILMETSDYKISHSDKVALEIITYVGCSLSLACLLLTICTLPCIRLREIRFKIHLHLCIALAAAQIVFLAGINAVTEKIPCMMVAIMLHYFYTVAFLWMLVEGVHLYQKIVVAYEKKVVKKKHYYMIAWGEK
ncbi:adhesion G-protein coupled receptor D1 [Exaiptasia diaphana]|uniref:G-protein coupled receptors family 2 profile 2 domain-containing protein n=1 Tax=Exaiptasia diaphana TaxID=2652724 RepID=A0A913YLE0_EXADI|nr:adhesion G-protein coupled receptor D1 [Exaiptasia diaphana]